LLRKKIDDVDTYLFGPEKVIETKLLKVTGFEVTKVIERIYYEISI